MARFAAHPDRRPAVVTGASSGIGRATAIALAAAGHPVVLGARRVEQCDQAAAEIRAAGGEAIALALDVHEEESVANFAEAANAKLGPIEVVVSNAGDVRPITVVGADSDEFARQVSVNLLGPQRLVHHIVPAMIERQRGDVVIVTSEVAVRPRPLVAGYVSAKAGLENMVRAMQMELEGTGVRVGMVRPGQSATEQGSTWPASDVEQVVSEWGRWGLLRHMAFLRPDDVAAAVLAMVSMPRGASLSLVEVQPEAPLVEPAKDDPR